MEKLYQKTLEEILSISKDHLSEEEYSKFKSAIIEHSKDKANLANKLPELANVIGNYLGKEIEEEWQASIFYKYSNLAKEIYSK